MGKVLSPWKAIEGKETNLICTHRGLIQMGPKKWPKQTAFIYILDQKIKTTTSPKPHVS